MGALRDLGSRGGGLRDEDVEQLAAISRDECVAEPGAHLYAGGVEGLGAAAPGRSATEGPGVVFRCDMLMSKARDGNCAEGLWRGVTCAGEDDFEALVKRR